jgi:hypothetical protein
MKVTETEYSVFRAIVKGIGVYQLVLGLTDIYAVILERTDFKLGGPAGHETHYLAMATFRFCVALVLLFGTDFFCRVAFPSNSSTKEDSGGA